MLSFILNLTIEIRKLLLTSVKWVISDFPLYFLFISPGNLEDVSASHRQSFLVGVSSFSWLIGMIPTNVILKSPVTVFFLQKKVPISLLFLFFQILQHFQPLFHVKSLFSLLFSALLRSLNEENVERRKCIYEERNTKFGNKDIFGRLKGIFQSKKCITRPNYHLISVLFFSYNNSLSQQHLITRKNKISE